MIEPAENVDYDEFKQFPTRHVARVRKTPCKCDVCREDLYGKPARYCRGVIEGKISEWYLCADTAACLGRIQEEGHLEPTACDPW